MSSIRPINHTYAMNRPNRIPPSTKFAVKLLAPTFSTSREMNTGIRKNTTIPSVIETLSNPAIASEENSCSFISPSPAADSLAEIVKDFIPTIRVSRRTSTPRRNAILRSEELAQLSRGTDRRTINPSGRRTAKAARLCPRIITPSITA